MQRLFWSYFIQPAGVLVHEGLTALASRHIKALRRSLSVRICISVVIRAAIGIRQRCTPCFQSDTSRVCGYV